MADKCRNLLITVEQLQKALKERGEATTYTGIFDYAFRKTTDFEWLMPFVQVTDSQLQLNKATLQLLIGYRAFAPEYDSEGNITYEDTAMYERISYMLRSLIRANEYKLQKLIDSMSFEYNPIDNVNEDTVETMDLDTADGRKTNTDSKGLSDTDSVGSSKSETKYGSMTENTNDTYGTRTDSTVYGAQGGMENLTHNISPFDQEEFHSESHNQNYTSTDEHTDTFSSGEELDTHLHTVNAHSDGISANTDSTNSTSYSNSILMQTDGVTATTYTKHIVRHGNIGTVSTQELISQERALADFSIYEEIINIFVKHFCNGVYSDCVARDTWDRRCGWYDDYIL